MKIFDNCVRINSKEVESYIIINIINGLIDQLDIQEKEVFDGWKLLDNIKPNNEYETEFFNNLFERGYLIEDKDREETIKMERINQIFNIWREQPYSIGIVPTYECNFRCSYCYEETLIT